MTATIELLTEDGAEPALGRKVEGGRAQLDTFGAPLGVDVVTLTTEHYTSLCPVTGQPDFWTVLIEYEPAGLCVETKSLKLHLGSYRNEGHFCEALVGLIADALDLALMPRSLQVTVTFAVRGGIVIEAHADRVNEALT